MHAQRPDVEWIVRFVRFPGGRSREGLFPAAPKIAPFRTALAVQGHGAAATQNQALNALACLDTRGLNQALQGRINAVRAAKKTTAPAVRTREEVAAISSRMDGTAPLVATRLYGSGWRRMEAVRLRGQGIDSQLKPLTVRAGKGDKARVTTAPVTRTPLLQHHLAGVRTRPRQERAQGHGEGSRPRARARQAAPPAREWGWPYASSARDLSGDPRAGVTPRRHMDPSGINKAIKAAVRHAGLTKPSSARTCRHAFATHLLQRGTDIRTIQPLLGHQDRAATMIDTHILQQGDQGVPSPLDDRGV